MKRARFADHYSTILVAVAAAMWSTDAYFRPVLVHALSASEIVLVEDFLICLCFLPLVPRVLRELRQLDARHWLALIVIAAGPQAVATVLFTRSLSFAFPAQRPPNLAVLNEVYFLYLLQPLFAVAGATLVLRERRRPYFWALAALAFAGVYLIVFPQDPLAPFSTLEHAQLIAALLVLGAVILWASGTVLGRYALQQVSFLTTSTMRFSIALPVLLVLTLVDTGARGFGHYAISQLPSFLGIALIPGVVAMLVYYRGLSSTPASLATFAELGYPCALFLAFSLPKPVGLGAPLHLTAVLGALTLVVAVTALNGLKQRHIVEPAAPPARVLTGIGALD